MPIRKIEEAGKDTGWRGIAQRPQGLPTLRTRDEGEGGRGKNRENVQRPTVKGMVIERAYMKSVAEKRVGDLTKHGFSQAIPVFPNLQMIKPESPGGPRHRGCPAAVRVQVTQNPEKPAVDHR